MKSLILCADDYALNPGISRGIRQLAARGKLSAVSCFTFMASWEAEGPALAACGGDFDIGLHFSLTHHLKPSLTDWITRSLRGKIDRAEIEDHLAFQWERFRGVLGRDPDYLDGHQHVHALPGIAPIIEETLHALGAPDTFPIRRVDRPLLHPAALSKSTVLRFLVRRGQSVPIFPGNDRFAGLYSFRGNFSSLLYRWIRDAPDGTLIMCHPGLPDDDSDDPIASARLVEFDTLSRDWFDQILAKCDARLGRFSHMAANS
ncbi:MAG: ChbG/HpnK family deacetylase [Luteolibacter sp.]